MKNLAIVVFTLWVAACSAQTTCTSDGGVYYRQNHYDAWQRTGITWVLELATSVNKKTFPMSDLTHAVIVATKDGESDPFQSIKLGKYEKTTSNGDGYVTVSFIAENKTVFQIVLNEKLQMDAFIMLNALGGDVQCQCKL